jgi:rfaE bifunctional protein kinase chain/domain
MFSRSRLLQLTEAMKGKLVVVYGDIVADRFIYGTPKRISREAPVLILRQYRDDVLLGGAGNAINNTLSLGGLPIPVSVVGKDANGDQLIERLTTQGIDCGAILRVDRYNTPTKVRSSAACRIHRGNRSCGTTSKTTSRSQRKKRTFAWLLRDQIAICHAALISDYGYGVVTPSLAANLTGFSKGKPVTLDSRYDLLRYPDVIAATPNEEEAAAAAGMSLYDDDNNGANVEFVAQTLQQSLDAEAILITRGSRGMALFERGGNAPLLLPVYGTDQVADVTGAGDTVIATFTLALAAVHRSSKQQSSRTTPAES